MFKKTAITTLENPVFLNQPDFSKSEYEYLKNIDVKIASKEEVAAVKDSEGSGTQFELEAEIREHPDSLFFKSFAIRANEMNDNGDYFSREELKKSYGTFVGVPCFTNHQNQDIEKAKGTVIHSWYDDERDGIMVIARIDAVAYPDLARSIKEKIAVYTSMGAQVKLSVCSICHNAATTPEDYCGCIRERKGKKFSGKKKCLYAKSKNLEPDADGKIICPICNASPKQAKTNEYLDRDTCEYNYGIKFIENSFVVNPACHTCGVTEIIDASKFIKKVAAIVQRLPILLKRAERHPELMGDVVCTPDGCIKVASQKELDDLGQAMDLMVNVSKTMLDQRDQVDLEFLSDLMKVIADLQSVTDELTEMGYARLPGGAEQPEIPGVAPETVPQTVGVPTAAPAAGPAATTPGASQVSTGPVAGGIGSVTSPIARSELKLRKKAQKLALPLDIRNQNSRIGLSDVLNLSKNSFKRLELDVQLKEPREETKE